MCVIKVPSSNWQIISLRQVIRGTQNCEMAVVCQGSGGDSGGKGELIITHLGRPSFGIHKTDTRIVSLRSWGE